MEPTPADNVAATDPTVNLETLRREEEALAALRSQLETATERMGFWLNLFVPPNDGSEGLVAFEDFGYTVSQAAYDEGLANFLADPNNPGATEEDYRKELSRQLLLIRWLEESRALDDQDFRLAARRELRRDLANLTLDHELKGITVSDDQVAAEYNRRIAEFSTPEKIQVQIILVPTEAEAMAILKRLYDGENFSQVAGALSRHESSSRGGDLEPFPRGTYVKEMEELAFSLSVGEIGHMNAAAGTFIVRKVASIPPIVTPLSEVGEKVRADLEKDMRQRKVDEILNHLREQLAKPR